MSPILFKIGPMLIYSYGLMIGIGVILAMWLSERNAKKEALNHLKVLDLMLVLFFCSIAGGRLAVVLLSADRYLSDPLSIFKLWEGGLAFYGGLALALPVGVWYLKTSNLPILKTIDVIVPYIPLAHAFGRIGCFLQGCCHGTLTKVPWAVRFPKWISAVDGIIGTPVFIQHMDMGLVRSSATFSLPVHPTQLYSSAALFMMFLILLIVRRRRHFNGEALSCYLILYSATRFVSEFFRADSEKYFLNLTAPQIVSIPVFVFAIVLAFNLARRVGGATEPAKAAAHI